MTIATLPATVHVGTVRTLIRKMQQYSGSKPNHRELSQALESLDIIEATLRGKSQ